MAPLDLENNKTRLEMELAVFDDHTPMLKSTT